MDNQANNNNNKVTELKVENWGVFFFQRVNNFYCNEKFTDVTLQFSDNKQIKVHQLVLHACTDYFENLLSNKSTSVLQVPYLIEDVLPIINFMYSGKLVYNTTSHKGIYNAAREFRMTILTSLLENQMKQQAPAPDKTVEDSNFEVAVVANSEGEEPGSANQPTIEPPLITLTPVTDDNSAEEKILSINDVRRLKLADKTMPKRNEKIRQVLDEAPSANPQKTQVWRKTIGNITKTSLAIEIKGNATPPAPPIPTRFEMSCEPLSAYNAPVLNESIDYYKKQISYEKYIPINQPLDLISQHSESVAPCTSPHKKVDIVEIRQRKARSEIIRSRDDDDDDDMIDSSEPEPGPSTVSPKPILKRVVDSGTFNAVESSKRVRFTVADESSSSNSQDSIPEKIPKSSNSIKPTEPIIGKIDNPAKIVTEVLKKYPDLMLGSSKNIKLKVRTNLSSGSAPGENSSAGVSYIYVKGSNAAEAASPISTDSLIKDRIQKTKELEKTKGPWICSCSSDNSTVFNTYSVFREHLIKEHGMAIDSRLCEECGMRISKRNTLLHHMFVKHNIRPPPGVTFPQCDQCSHIASSMFMLKRHKESSHTASTDIGQTNASSTTTPATEATSLSKTTPSKTVEKSLFPCAVCNITFNTMADYTAHVNSDWHKGTVQAHCEYPCAFCDEGFATTDELKRHMDVHQNQIRNVAKLRGEGTSSKNSFDSQTSAETSSQEQTVYDDDPTDPSRESQQHDENNTQLQYVEDQQGNIIYMRESGSEETYQEVSVFEQGFNHQDDGQTEVLQESVTERADGYFVETEGGRMFIMKSERSFEEPQEQYTATTEDSTSEQDSQQTAEQNATAEEIAIDNTGDCQGDEPLREEAIPENPAANKVEDDVEPVKAETAITASSPGDSGPLEPNESDQQQEDSSAAGGDDRGYSSYNSVMMFPPNVVAAQRAVILHPGNMVITAPLQVIPPVFLSAAPTNILHQEQLVIPVTYTERVVAGDQPLTRTIQSTKKVETSNLVSDWDENSENDATVNTNAVNNANICSGGPSRPEFF